MPPKTKSKKAATAASKWKGNALQKKARVAEDNSETEWMTGDEEEPSLRKMVENMGSMLTTLMHKMQQLEQRPETEEMSAATHNLYAGAVASTSTQEAQAQAPVHTQPPPEASSHPDVSDEVRVQVARHLNTAPMMFPLTDDDSDTNDEERAQRRRHRVMKSGKIRTTDVYVTKRVRWPHEMVSSTQGQTPIYLEMSLALFTNGY